MDQCEQCGFDFNAVPPVTVPLRVRRLPAEYAAKLRDADRDAVARERPQPETWSPLEYTCHFRDVLRVQRERIGLALEQDRPDFVPMRRDERATEERYNEQALDTVLAELAEAADRFADTVDALRGEQWQRTGLYHWPEPAERSLEWVTRQTLHEGLHHLQDINVGVASLRATRP